MTVKTRQSLSNRLRDMVKSNPQAVKVAESDIILPVDDQAGFSQTIQTHSTVVIAPSTGNNGTWIDTDGFDRVSLTVLNSGLTPNSANIDWSNDGVNIHLSEAVIANHSNNTSGALIETKARYMKVFLWNGHTAPSTFNAWVLLKA